MLIIRHARYAKNALNTCYKTLQTTLTDGAGQVAMRWSAGDYGYYMIRVTEEPEAVFPGYLYHWHALSGDE